MSFGEKAQRIFDWFLPPRCLKCQEVVEKQGLLCSPCWVSLNFISRPFCEKCGYPFELPSLAGTLCGRCLQKEPPFHKGRSLLKYDESSKGLLLRFKHGDATFLAPYLAQWLRRGAKDFLEGADFIIPVPLHWTRLMKRRYNQAALLAQALSKLTGISFLPQGLKRYRRTSSQGQKSFEERYENVKGVFSLSPKCAKIIEGKTVILVDDVITSGATVYQCARVLEKAKVRAVNVLALARVVLP